MVTSEIFAIAPFDGECQILQSSFYIFHFRYGVTYANDVSRQTNTSLTDRHIETDNSLAISETRRLG